MNIFTQLDEPEKKDGIWVQTVNQYEKIYLNEKYANYESGAWSFVSTLPYKLYGGSAVVYNGEVHIIGGIYNTYHYKYNTITNTWDKETELPKAFYMGSAIVYNERIHIMAYLSDTYEGEYDYHYMYDGFTWTRLKNIPYRDFYGGHAVIYNGEMHILGGQNITNNWYYPYHYKWNADSDTWTTVSSLPDGFGHGSVVVYNGNIHILGGFYKSAGGSATGYHYIYNGFNWLSANSLPYKFKYESTVIYNGEIHILGDRNKYHYKWNSISDTWTSVSTLPYDYCGCGCAVIYEGDIHLLGGYDGDDRCNYHYQFQAPKKVYNPNTLIINKGTSTGTGTYVTEICTPEIENNQRFLTGFDDVFFFADSSFDWNAPMYYGNGSSWIKFKN